MSNRWEFLRNVSDVQLFPPVPEAELAKLPVRLPDAHLELLRFTDGLVAAGGDIRIFGLGSCVRDQVRWNALDAWRFAHPGEGRGFWFFADAPSGSQFAYELDHDGNLCTEHVVSVRSDMVPGWTLPGFETLMERAVVKHGDRPIDPEMTKVYRRTGRIPPDKMVMPIPPECFEGPDYCDREMMIMDARTAMIIEGDMSTELQRVMYPKRMDTYTDERGLTRIRLIE